MHAAEAAKRLVTKLRGMRARIARARRESSQGCKLQTQWLMDHAELIGEVEKYRGFEQPRRIPGAARVC